MAERKQPKPLPRPGEPGAAVPVKPVDEGLLTQLLALLNQPQAPAPPSTGNPAQGIVDATGRIVAPVKRGMDWLQNLGK